MATRAASRTTTTVSASTAISLYAANPSMAAVAIQDSTANVGKYLDGLDGLARAGKIVSVSLTDTTTMTISGAQFAADAAVIAFLPQRSMLVVRQASVAQAPALQTDVRVKSFTLLDSTLRVSAALDTLNADTRLTGIALTDTAPIAMTHAQMLADTFVLARLPGSATYSISNVGVANAAAVSANVKVARFGVVDTAQAVATLPALAKLASAEVRDTAAAIAAQLESLATVPSLTLLTPTDMTVLGISAAQYATLGAVLARLAPGDTLAVGGVSAAGAAAVAADPRVSAIMVADTLANIGASLDTLDALAEAGTLTAIAVTDTGQTLTLSVEQYTADQQALALMSGDYKVVAATAPPAVLPAAKAPVINLIWDESVAAAPVGFREAVQYAASFYDALITSPITVNIEVGYGEARDTALAAGLLGQSYVTSAVNRSFTQFKADLTAHNTSAEIATALGAMTDPGDGKSIFVAGAEAKALGIVSATDTKLDGAIGFATDPTGSMFTYDPAARAVAGKVDFIGVAQHEIAHALGRVSYLWTRTAFDLYRYAAPGVRAAAGPTPAYLSIDGGVTNLGGFSTTGDYADWGQPIGTDAQNAFLGTGIQFEFSTADVTALNVLGYAVDGAVASAATGSATLANATTTGSGAAAESPTTENGGRDPWQEVMAAFRAQDPGWGRPLVPTGLATAAGSQRGGWGAGPWQDTPPAMPHWLDRD